MKSKTTKTPQTKADVEPKKNADNKLSKTNTLTTQRKLSETIHHSPLQKKANKTGLPDNVKSGIESLSGIGLDDVKVHYNSTKPAQMKANAFTQGNQIHIGPGQNQYLGHEAWHVVQQKQGRVKPTKQEGNIPINDSPALEQEADVMGGKALQFNRDNAHKIVSLRPPAKAPAQFNRNRNLTLLGGMATGAMLGSLWGPLGAAIGGLGGLALGIGGYSLLGKKPKPTKLKISNNSLEKREKQIAKKLAMHAPDNLLKLLGTFKKRKKQKDRSQKYFNAQFTFLNDIETTAYTILKADIPQSLQLKIFSILSELEAEHVQLTKDLLKNKRKLWIKPGLKSEETEQAHKLWKSLIGNHGNVKVTTKNQEFKDQVFSNYAKLLQGSHGISMLSKLNAPQLDKEKGIYITDNIKGHFTAPWHEEEKSSYAEPIARAEHNINLHTEVTDFEKGKVVKRPNKGTGSYVKIADPPPVHYDDYQIGTNGKAIYNPSFINLGHELGHAESHLRGQTKNNLSETQSHPRFFESQMWTDEEELRNITVNENPLRKENGLPMRKYHKTIRGYKCEALRMNLTHRLLEAWDSLPTGKIALAVNTIGTPQTLMDEIEQKKTQLDKPKVARDLSHRVLTYENSIKRLLK